MLFQVAFVLVAFATGTVAQGVSCQTTGSDDVVCRACPSLECPEVARMTPGGWDIYDCMWSDGDLVDGAR